MHRVTVVYNDDNYLELQELFHAFGKNSLSGYIRNCSLNESYAQKCLNEISAVIKPYQIKDEFISDTLSRILSVLDDSQKNKIKEGYGSFGKK